MDKNPQNKTQQDIRSLKNKKKSMSGTGQGNKVAGLLHTRIKGSKGTQGAKRQIHKGTQGVNRRNTGSTRSCLT